MAGMSPPKWAAEDGSQIVTRLPGAITVTYRVTSDRAGFLVHYRLHSARVQFKTTAATPPITPKEAAGSTPPVPPLTPESRDLRVIDDAYPGQGPATRVERVIELLQSGADKPGFATLEITVSEFDGTDADEDSVVLAFAV